MHFARERIHSRLPATELVVSTLEDSEPIALLCPRERCKEERDGERGNDEEEIEGRRKGEWERGRG